MPCSALVRCLAKQFPGTSPIGRRYILEDDVDVLSGGACVLDDTVGDFCSNSRLLSVLFTFEPANADYGHWVFLFTHKLETSIDKAMLK